MGIPLSVIGLMQPSMIHAIGLMIHPIAVIETIGLIHAIALPNRHIQPSLIGANHSIQQCLMGTNRSIGLVHPCPMIVATT